MIVYRQQGKPWKTVSQGKTGGSLSLRRTKAQDPWEQQFGMRGKGGVEREEGGLPSAELLGELF